MYLSRGRAEQSRGYNVKIEKNLLKKEPTASALYLTEAGLEDMLGEGIFDLASSLKNFAS
jgi:hypothetical protein